MRTVIVLFLAMLVFSVSFAAVTCSPSFTENFTVRVLDSQLRPVEGVAVQIRYQLDQTTSKGYVTTPIYYTNASGTTEYIRIHNIEAMPSRVDCVFVVNATYGGKTVKKSFTVGQHSEPVDLQLDLNILTLKITDQNGHPLGGAEVWVNGMNKTSDSNGYVITHVPDGTVSVLVKYSEGKLTDSFKVTDDYSKTLGLTLYSLTITVMDDAGNPLNATASVGSRNFTADANGKITVDTIASASPPVIVYYENLAKGVDVDLSVQPKYNVIFDVTPPAFGTIKTAAAGKATKLIIPVSDPGLYSTGIPPKGIVARYKKSTDADWREIPVYLSGKDQYVAEIPEQPPETLVYFSVDAKDRDGNSRSVEGQFITPPAPVTPPINQTGNGGQPGGKKDEGIPLLYLVAGFIIIAVIIYLVYRWKFSGEGEQA